MNHDEEMLERLEADEVREERISSNLREIMKWLVLVIVICVITLLAGCTVPMAHCWGANANQMCRVI